MKNISKYISIIIIPIFGIVFMAIYNNVDAQSLTALLKISKKTYESKELKRENLQNMKVFETGMAFETGTESHISPDSSTFEVEQNHSVERENIGSNNDYAIYTVQSGESLESIAKYFEVSVDSIITTNKLKNKAIRKDDVLEIPSVSGIAYEVKNGDTLNKIAKKYNIDPDDIALYNDLFSDDIAIGDEIYLPGAKDIVGENITSVKKVSPKIQSKKQWANGDTSHLNTSALIDKYANLPKYIGYFVHPSPGATRTQTMHGANSVDLANTKGAPVLASASGVVKVAKSDGYNFGYGKYIIITHPNGSETLYAHNSELLVSVGQSVAQGQQIAKIGSTGNSTGPHVHFEIRGAYNPFAW